MELPHVLGNQVAPSGELLWLKVGLWGLWWVLVVWGMFSASYKQFCSLAMERRLHEIWASLARMLLWNQCYLSLIPTANPGARRWWHKPFGWFFLFSFLSAPLGKFLWILGFSRETAPKACVCVWREGFTLRNWLANPKPAGWVVRLKSHCWGSHWRLSGWILLMLWEVSPCSIVRPFTDRMRPTHLMEGNLLHVKPTGWNVNLT